MVLNRDFLHELLPKGKAHQVRSIFIPACAENATPGISSRSSGALSSCEGSTSPCWRMFHIVEEFSVRKGWANNQGGALPLPTLPAVNRRAIIPSGDHSVRDDFPVRGHVDADVLGVKEATGPIHLIMYIHIDQMSGAPQNVHAYSVAALVLYLECGAGIDECLAAVDERRPDVLVHSAESAAK
ncbi:hypothetical protein PRIPAC_72857 [Pristionchus pacificus]|uniref:Uncharacterized protein n=1 Tax=Pristionchus pacificus TaxID=54126 RepID=A0A2A6C863_PRIPA|nr:hypothetical protein PRIPAC_72857 [Pristionchus pacificus]|eukprot:PDM74290.1 hypothetical protein PRIPAC_41646 [Pristionchus pacificus]